MIELQVEPVIGRTTADYRFTDRAWGIALRKVNEGQVGEFDLIASRAESGAIWEDVGIGFRLAGDKAKAHTFGAYVRLSAYGQAFQREIRDGLIGFAKETARWFSAAYGFISLNDVGLDETPYEGEMERIGDEGLRECRELARGYFWGNFLSEQHIDRLGGMERIRRDAPSFLVEELSLGHDALIYLQATERPDASNEALETLGEFLKPILPTQKTVREWDPDLLARVQSPPVLLASIHPIPVESTGNFSDLDTPFTLYLERPLSELGKKEFEKLFDDWIGVGWYGGFGGDGFRYASDLAFLDDEGQPTIEWVIDTRHEGLDAAVMVLVRSLEHFMRFSWADSEGKQVVFKRLVLGWRTIE